MKISQEDEPQQYAPQKLEIEDDTPETKTSQSGNNSENKKNNNKYTESLIVSDKNENSKTGN
jgi:hypothetical protein